jgi:hypothetical protein
MLTYASKLRAHLAQPLLLQLALARRLRLLQHHAHPLMLKLCM